MCPLSSGSVRKVFFYPISSVPVALRVKPQDNKHLSVKGKQIRQAPNCTLNSLWGIRTWPSALLGQNTKARQTLQDTSRWVGTDKCQGAPGLLLQSLGKQGLSLAQQLGYEQKDHSMKSELSPWRFRAWHMVREIHPAMAGWVSVT